MSSWGKQPVWTRRRLMATGCSAVGSLAVGTVVRAQGKSSSEQDGPYHPFKMGLQSYSLRGYTSNGRPDRDKALEVTKDLGLHFWESYPAHVPILGNSQAVSFLRREIEAKGVTVVGYGVVPITKDYSGPQKLDHRLS